MATSLPQPFLPDPGHVSVGQLFDYAAGRSHGCTSWGAGDAAEIIPSLRNNPTTLYIYPESRDMAAVANAVKTGATASGAYWNNCCQSRIGAPKFSPATQLAPIIALYRQTHPRRRRARCRSAIEPTIGAGMAVVRDAPHGVSC